jgi:hypothetical protein
VICSSERALFKLLSIMTQNTTLCIGEDGVSGASSCGLSNLPGFCLSQH